MAMEKPVFTLLASLIFLWSPTSSAATFYVATNGNDANSCTTSQDIGAPKRTIDSGVACLKAGDTLLIRGGVYAEQLRDFHFLAGGTSWASPITVSSFSGESVTLRPVTTQGNVASVGDAHSYIVLNGLILDGISAGGGAGGSVFYCSFNSHHVRLSNVEIMNGDGNGILCGGSSHEFLNLKVHNNGLSGSYTNSNGMYMCTQNTLIDGGEFYDNECYGVRYFNSDPALSADNNIVRNTRIHGNGRGHGLSGSSVCGSGGGGIILGDTNNLAYNNLVHGNYWGLAAYSKGSGSKFFNNTVYGNDYGVDLGVSIYAQLKNNIIYDNLGVEIYDVGTTGLSSSNNLTTNPGFVNAAIFDLHLQSGSPAIDAGVNLAPIVTSDFDGGARPQGLGFDIGAYEYGSSTPQSTPTPSPTPTPTPTPSPTPTPTPTSNDVTRPTVTITAPTNEATVPAKKQTTITAVATDDVGVVRVDFYVGGTLKCSDTSAPYSCVWNVPGARGKPYLIRVQAVDSAGNIGEASVTVTAR